MRSDNLNRILELKQLFEHGAITEAEYHQRKSQLLDRISGDTPTSRASQAGSGAPMHVGTDLNLTGALIGPQQRYRIEKSLGKGTFGEVYLAEDIHTSQQLGRSTWLAIKFLNPRFAQDRLFQQRLTLEATQVIELEHENIWSWNVSGGMRAILRCDTRPDVV